MSEFRFNPGDRVYNPCWPTGTHAIVVRTDLMPVRARLGARGRTLKPRAEDCEAVVTVDRHMPVGQGAVQTDDRWMEAGLTAAPDEHPSA